MTNEFPAVDRSCRLTSSMSSRTTPFDNHFRRFRSHRPMRSSQIFRSPSSVTVSLQVTQPVGCSSGPPQRARLRTLSKSMCENCAQKIQIFSSFSNAFAWPITPGCRKSLRLVERLFKFLQSYATKLAAHKVSFQLSPSPIGDIERISPELENR